MSASTSGALKAFIEAQGLGVSAYQDEAPENTALPYVTVHEGISTVPEPYGDNGNNGVASEEAQVSVWQRRRNADTDARVESYSLATDLARALHGAQLETAPQKVYGMFVIGHGRLVEEENNIVHNPITVRIRRAL